MNILELNFEKNWRGGERQTLYNMQGFRNAGITVHLVCRKGSAMELEAKKNGFISHEFSSIFGVIFFLLTSGKNYNLIHARTSHILTYCVFTKWFHRRRIIFTRRVNFLQKGFFTKLEYQYTDKIVVISEAIKKRVIAFSGRNDIEVISDIVVKSALKKIDAAIAFPLQQINGRHVIGTTSALTHEKDPFTMIDAIKKLFEKRQDFVFLHFGSGDLEKRVEQKIYECNLQDNYFLMGFRNDAEDLFSIFEVFVITSKEEGLGSSVLDAFIYGVPVVSTNAGGLKDLLQSERGVLCETADSRAIASGIKDMLVDYEKRNRYVDNGFKYANHYHSMEFITGKYLDLINKMSS